jgi:hypothetical protein
MHGLPDVMHEHAAMTVVACRGAATVAAALHCRHCRCVAVHRRPSQSPLRRRRRHPPPPAFADPFVGWLLRCFPPSAFIITCYHATIDALDASRFCRQLSSTATTAATTAAAAAARTPPPPPPPPWSNSPSYIDEERGSSSTTTTSIPAAAPSCKRLQVQTTWTYLTYLQFLKCAMLVECI